MNNSLAIDLGFGYSKVCVQRDNKFETAIFPTAVAYEMNNGVSYGSSKSFEFEGERFIVGDSAVDGALVSTDYKFLYRFAPLLVYSVLKKFDEINLSRPITLRTGLSINDWANKDAFAARLSEFEVNGEKVKLEVQLLPQGIGLLNYYYHKHPEVLEKNSERYAKTISIIDIGTRTVNFIYVENGQAVRSKSAPYADSGTITILKSFSEWLENKYGTSFSVSEAMNIFVNGKMVYNGVDQEDVKKEIENMKHIFIKQLFQTVLTSKKKLLGMSDLCIFGGGGAKLLLESNTEFPPNTVFVEDPQYANCIGFMLP